MKHDYFNKIETEMQAYLLGYFFADGYHYEKYHRMQITLAEIDIEIINLFKKEFESPNKITKILPKSANNQTLHMFTMCSKQMSRDLIKLGCFQKKSLTLTIPDLPDSTFRHFLRGYFDGDGCISLKENKDSTIIIECPIVCSNIFAEQLQKILLERFGWRASSQKLGKNKVCTTLKITGRAKSEVFLDWIYQNSIVYLSRKYKLYSQFKQYCNSVKKYSKKSIRKQVINQLQIQKRQSAPSL